MLLSSLAFCTLTCTGLGTARAAAGPNLVRIYTGGLNSCRDGGNLAAYVSPGEPGRAAGQAEPNQTGPLPTLEAVLKQLTRSAVGPPRPPAPGAPGPPLALWASAADIEAGLSVPSGQRVTLTLACGDTYAATEFTPRTDTDIRFSFGKPFGHGWQVYVGEAIGVTFNGK